jgi:hypothetical protein
MLSKSEIPTHVLNGPEGLTGDIEGFMELFSQGYLAKHYDALVAQNALDDNKIFLWMRSLNAQSV